MRHLALLATAALGCLTLAGPAGADPLDRSRVPASARWLVHVDFESALRSQLVTRFLENPEIKLELDEGIAELREHTGLDPMKDLFGITMFGSVQDPEQSVFLLSTSSAVEGVLQMLPELSEGQVDVSIGLVDGFEVTSIRERGDSRGEAMFVHPVRSPDGTRTTMVAGKKPALLGEAIRTVRGQGTSLASAMDPSLAARPRASSFLFVATADGIDHLRGVKPASQVARLAQGIVFDLGEERNALVGSLALTAATPEDANNMGSVLQGAVALANLAGADEPEAKPFLEMLGQMDFRTSDRTVTVSFAYEVDMLLGLVEQMSDRHHGNHDVHHAGESDVRVEKKYEFEY